MTSSYWQKTATNEYFPQLTEDHQTDVLVVGGGITGLMTAWNLWREGKEVTLVEAKTLGSGVTGYTTAHLTTAVDARYHRLTKDFDKETAALVAEAARLAIELVGECDKQHQLDANFERCQAYLYAMLTDHILEMEKEYSAAQEAGLKVHLEDKTEGLPYPTAGALVFEDNARFHPLKFIQALAPILQSKGVKIYEKTRVSNMEEDEKRAHVTLANGKTIRANHVVLATHNPLFMHPVQTRVAPYRSYAIAARTQANLPDHLWYDMFDPYKYIRKAEDDVVIIGGEDHKTGQASSEKDEIRALEIWAKNHLGATEVLARWSAQVYEPTDGLPFIGKAPGYKHTYYATGFSGDGTLWGSLSGLLISDLIMGKKNKFAKVFSPSRLNISAEAGTFIKENINVAKEFIVDRFQSDTSDVQKVDKGQGAIVRQGLQQYAVYRDEDNKLTVCSPTCPHMGCVVQWNKFEKTWDCPCHGGRFSPTGEVLEGPPASNLVKKEL